MSENQKPSRLSASNAVLVVVDMQERLVPAMRDKEQLCAACEKLVRGCRILELPALFTQQYTKGLGATIISVEESWTKGAAAEIPFEYFDKTSFSVCGDAEFIDAFKKLNKCQVILCGIEAHVCVLQSALDFICEGVQVFLAADAASSRFKDDYRLALKRMQHSGVVITSAESILFELMDGAKHPKFKEISALVK
jgi:isochorismate hydrolase